MFKNLSPAAVGIKANFQQGLDLAKRHGFGGIDVSLSEIAALIDQRGIPAINDLFAAAGLKLGAFGCPTNFRADEASWETSLAQLPRLAKTAKAIGATRCTTWIMSASDTLDYATNFEFHVMRLQPIAKILKEHGIQFGVEFIGPKSSRRGKKHEFIHNIEGVLELCDAIGTGNVGLLLDSWHWYTCHDSVEELKKLKAEDVIAVQVNDAPKGIAIDDQLDQVRDLPAATGVINLKAFMQTLKSIGYSGPVTPKPFRKDLATLPADQAAKLTADSMARLWELAEL